MDLNERPPNATSTMTAIALTRFWRSCDLENPPYLHPCDDLPEDSVQQGVHGYVDYVAAFEDGRLSDTAFHLHLLPQPYFGDLENAEVIILLKNPGFKPSDYRAEENPCFRQALVRNIRQETRSHMFLDPKWAFTGGFNWWESKLARVARRIADNCFGGDYPKALADLARRIASLELVPYHSKRFKGTTQLASACAARRFAREASRDRNREIVVVRAAKHWGIGNGPNVVTYSAGQARGASFGPESPGGGAILALYGIKSG